MQEEYRVLDMHAKQHAVVTLEEMLELLNKELSDKATIGYCTHVGFNLPYVEDLFESIGTLGKTLNLRISFLDSIPGLQEPYSPTRTSNGRTKRKLPGANIPNVPLSEIPYNHEDSDLATFYLRSVSWINILTSYQQLLSPTELGLLIPLLLEAELLTSRKRRLEPETTYTEWMGSKLSKPVQIIGIEHPTFPIDYGYKELVESSFGYYLANLEWLVLRRQIKQSNILLQQPVFIPDKEKELHPYREHLGQGVLILQLIRDERHLSYILNDEYKSEIVEKYKPKLPPKFIISPKNPRSYLFQGLRGDTL